MTPTLPDLFALIYPTTRVRGRMIRRDTGGTIRPAKLTPARAEYLGRENVGWFVGGHPGVRQAAAQLGRLDANLEGGTWVLIPASGELTRELHALWPHPDHATALPRNGTPAWVSRKVWVIPPERLCEFRDAALQLPARVAGLLVLDPHCVMFKARGGEDCWGHVWHNDRPQRVVNFRGDLTVDGWQPPLIVLTARPAMAVNTEGVARAFCLEAFEFIAGDSFACWEEPIDPD